MSQNNRQCAYVKPDGTRCGGFHQRGRPFCFVHDPEKAEAHAQAVKKGGLSQQLMLPAATEAKTPEVILPTKPLRLKRAGDVKQAIARVLGEIRTGATSLERGRTLLYGLGVHIQAIRDLEAPERLEKLERLLRERGMLQD